MTNENGAPSAVESVFLDHLANVRTLLCKDAPFRFSGRLSRINGMVMEATGIRLPMGASCEIETLSGKRIPSEVVGFEGDTVFMMASGDVHGLAPGARVFPDYARHAKPALGERVVDDAQDMTKKLPVCESMLGRVVDAAGCPLDGLGPLTTRSTRALQAAPINPLERAPITAPLDVGIRAINGLLTVGRGQRIGLFAGSGVGKSVLLGMMAKTTAAEVIVVGLIGERGREVKEFIDENLGEEGRRRAVVVAAPADTSPLMRLQGAAYATTIAEYFRDQGKQVLLIMDSLTRYAMAQREIALAVGEPPATRGYPPSVFARLPALVERAGNGAVRDGRAGSITAFYTVLAEGDDQQDPIADAARAILDGHIVLSRTLADQGHYPAIDIEQSISRVMHKVVDPVHLERARKLKHLFATYQRSRDLIAVGAYQKGGDPILDKAILLYPQIAEFLQQSIHEKETFERASGYLSMIVRDA